MADKSAAKSPIAPHLALIAVQLIFGTWGIVGKVALRAFPALGLSALRVAGAALAFILIGRIRGRMKTIRKRDWPLLIVCAAVGVAFNQWLFVNGLSLTTVVNTVLISTSLPVFTFLVSVIMGIERASLARLLGIALAAAGVIYLISPARTELASGSRLGDFLVAMSALCYGSYIAISKPLVNRYGALTTIAWIFIVGSVFTSPVGAASLWHLSWTKVTTSVWLSLIYILLVPTMLAYFLNTWALKQVPPSTVAVYVYLQPLIAFAVAPLLLGEKLGWRVVFASALIFSGVAITTRRRKVANEMKRPEAFGH